VRLLEYTSDGYISAAIAKISNYLRLSESLAGSTLLAFSNGASDVITALVASDAEGDNLVMGSLFGASIFTMTCCLGVIIIFSQKGEVSELWRVRFPAIITCYLLTIALLLVVGSLQVPYLYLGIVLLLIYVIYVAVIETQERITQSERLTSLRNQLSKISGLEDLHKRSSQRDELAFLDDNRDQLLPQNTEDLEKQKESLLVEIDNVKKRPRKLSGSFRADEWLMSVTDIAPDAPTYVKLMRKVHTQINSTWSSRNPFLQALYVVEIGLHLLVRLTLPPVDSPLLFKAQQYIYPFTSIFFCMFSKGVLADSVEVFDTVVPLWLLGLAAALVLNVVVYFSTLSRYKPTPRSLFLAITTVTGLFWLDFIVGIICDMINYVQLWTDASDLYLGMILLGIGNSSVDMFVDYTLARKGFEVMAITGIFSGQMFNLLVGFGLSCLIRGVKDSSLKFHVFDWDTLSTDKAGCMVFLIITSCALILVVFAVALPATKYAFKRKTGVVAILGYVSILGGMTAVEVLWDKRE